MSKIRYIIGYDPEANEAVAYPSWKSMHSAVIGEYTPTNPRANLTEYLPKLLFAVRTALEQDLRDSTGMSVRIVPLDGTKDVHKPLT